MMFRRLYWVTEDVKDDGSTSVHGVFTSIPDLIERDLKTRSNGNSVRLNLVKLDCKGEPLRTWKASDFGGMEADLQPFIQTEEFSSEHCMLLVQALNGMAEAKV